MNLYIVIFEDRDICTEVYSFSDREKAISEAKRVAKERCINQRYYWELEEPPPHPFFVNYSEDCDCASVITTELDKDIYDEVLER